MGWATVFRFMSADKGAQAGPPGPKGQDGSQWLTGTNAPVVAQGNPGDFFLRSSTGDVWRKVAPLSLAPPLWQLLGNLRGPQGLQGIAGPAGSPGPTGPPGAASILPTGLMLPCPGYQVPAGGFLFCDGTAYLRAAQTPLQQFLSFQVTCTPTNASLTVLCTDTSKLYLGMPVEGPGITAPVTFTATISSGSASMTSVSPTTGLAVGQVLYDAAGNLPVGVFINAIAGTTITLGKYYPSITSSTAGNVPNLAATNFFPQVTKAGNTYIAVPAIRSLVNNTSFGVPVNNTSGGSPVSLTFFPFGNGDGTSLFQVPDLRGRFPLGALQNKGNASTFSPALLYPVNNPIGLMNDYLAQGMGSDAVTGGSGLNVLDVGTGAGNVPTWPSFLAMAWVIKT